MLQVFLHKKRWSGSVVGLWLDNKLDLTCNTDHLYKRGQSRLFFLRRVNICRYVHIF